MKQKKSLNEPVDIVDSYFVDIPMVGVKTKTSFLVSNPTDTYLTGIVAKSSDSCIRRITGEHNLSPGEVSWLDYELEFSKLPCDATIEFYSGGLLLGFKKLTSSSFRLEVPKYEHIFFSSIFRLVVLLIWLLLLLLAFQREKKNHELDDKNNIYEVK